MKIVSWNIRHGGSKKKMNDICKQIEVWNPDVIGLIEFRESNTSQTIAQFVSDHGLVYQLSTIDAPERGKNFLLLASRFPLQAQPAEGRLNALGRWLHGRIGDLDVILVHVPNRSADKWLFHDEIIARFIEMKERPVVCFGDTNTGNPGIDEESKFFNRREREWFERIADAGWVDTWRDRNPAEREFSWYSNHNNGFRIDQVFTPEQFNANITSVEYDWGGKGRNAALSDHAAIVFEIAEESNEP